MSWPLYWQASPRWSKEMIAPAGLVTGLRLGPYGCVVSAGGVLREAELGVATTPHDALALAANHLGALTTGGLVFWPEAAKAWGMVAGEAIAVAPDHEAVQHEFFGHEVDPNADLAGALAEILAAGDRAAVRVDIDGDGLGDHTIAALCRDGAGFLCSCTALARLVTLDANLEAADVHWGSKPHPYRAVGVRAVRRI